MRVAIIVFTVLVSFNVEALEIRAYSEGLAGLAPHYSLEKYRPYALKDRRVRLVGRVVKVSGNFLSNITGTSSFVFHLRNLRREGYSQDYGNIYVSGEAIASLRGQEGRMIMIEGVVQSGELSRMRVKGERILALGLEAEIIWK